MAEKKANDSYGAVNASWLRVHATLTAIALLKRFRPRFSSVLMLTPKICVKYGPFQHLAEAAAMQYITTSTSMPVPKVHCAFERHGTVYIVMSRLDGSPIGHEWEQRPEESKRRLLNQLRRYLQEMRTLLPPVLPGGLVKAADGGRLFDVRLPGGVGGFGPFDSVRDFHDFLRDGIGSSPEQLPEVNELVKWHQDAQDEIRFTHGDLSSMNILVKGDDIVGIIDWETAGWYPEYWEYTTAMNVNSFNEFWKVEIPKFLDDDPIAAHMETVRQRHFNVF